MQLPEGKMYYRIGEVSTLLNVEPPTLRFWEKEFGMQPKRSGKERLYTPQDIETFELIKYLLKEEKYTIEGARQKMKQLKKAPKDTYQLIRLLEQFKEDLLTLKRQLKQS